VASSAYGLARATMDIDIVAALKREHVDPLLAMLQPAYYVDRSAALAAVSTHACFNLIHQDTMLKVDIFVMKDTAYDRLAMDRRRQEHALDGENLGIFFYAPEDVILRKLAWYRMGDEASERQWRDVLGIIQVQGKLLDEVYLRKWAKDLHVDDLLERAIAESLP